MNLQLIISNIKNNEQTRRAIFEKLIECIEKDDKDGFNASLELYNNYSRSMKEYLDSVDEDRLAILDKGKDGVINTRMIKELLISNISSYQIAKETKLSDTLIGLLRNGKQNIENLTIRNAIKLQEFYINNKE